MGHFKGPCRGTAGGTQRVVCTKIKFRLTQDPNSGETRTIEFAASTTTPRLEPGDAVVLSHLENASIAGMVLGALGALNDITVTQATAVGELRTAQPTLSRHELYRSGLRIGRDHISSTVNTLALAYAGASLPLLLLFTLSGQSLGSVANGEIVAVEIVSVLVGSIGLVAAVPISTWFASLVASEHSQSHSDDGLQPAGASPRRTRNRRDERDFWK